MNSLKDILNNSDKSGKKGTVSSEMGVSGISPKVAASTESGMDKRTSGSSLGTETFIKTSSFSANTSQNVLNSEQPKGYERREKPLIVQEKILPTERVEIQPIIYREREIPEYREIIQPMRERHVEATEVRTITLPAEHKPTIRCTNNQTTQKRSEKIGSETITAEVQREVITKPPIVREIIRTRIIQEIQPIIYKELIRPVVITQTQPVYKRMVQSSNIVEDTKTCCEVVPKEELSSQQSTGLTNLPILQNTSNIVLETQSCLDAQGKSKVENMPVHHTVKEKSEVLKRDTGESLQSVPNSLSRVK